MNLTTALRQSNNDEWLARKFGTTKEAIQEARAELTGARKPIAKAGNSTPVEAEYNPRQEQEWAEHAETASLKLRDAVRAYWSARRNVDWADFDAREAGRSRD